MIWIDLESNPPKQELIDEGTELTKQLCALKPEERDIFIDNNAAYWGKLKAHYSSLSNGKCWYTESSNPASYYHMDHFRPKKRVDELKDVPCETINSNEAYWWLAFDWENYRYSASIPNSRKRAYFPLKSGSEIAKNKSELDQEFYAILDPTNMFDVALVAFNEAGEVCPACKDTDSWDAMRVHISIKVYNLNEVSLTDARKEVQNTCERLIRRIKSTQRSYAQTNSPEYRKILMDLVKELREMTLPKAAFSAVARNYVRCDKEAFIRNIAS